MAQVNTTTQPHPQTQDELILVVKRDKLFPLGAWDGFKQVNFDDYLQIIQDNKEFLPRSLMEQDPAYKQIIPYLVFEHNNRYFLMQRHKKASEQRLQSKFSLGIGGHIRQEDMESSDLFDWAKREFHEEVHYTGNLTIEPLGILNDDSNDVGKVHIGFVFLLHGDTDQISVKSELQSGQLVTLKECTHYAERMETWSQLVVECLTRRLILIESASGYKKSQ